MLVTVSASVTGLPLIVTTCFLMWITGTTRVVRVVMIWVPPGVVIVSAWVMLLSTVRLTIRTLRTTRVWILPFLSFTLIVLVTVTR